jgi:hypothetical protein
LAFSGAFQRFGAAAWVSSSARRSSLDARSKALQEVAEFFVGDGQAMGEFVEIGHAAFLQVEL